MSKGRIIFYDVISGDVIVDTGESLINPKTQKTIEEEIQTYTELSNRNRGSFDYIELDYGEYRQDFIESGGVFRVNTELKTLEFQYPDENTPEEPKPYRAPLSEEVDKLKAEDLNNKEAIADLYIMTMMGGM